MDLNEARKLKAEIQRDLLHGQTRLHRVAKGIEALVVAEAGQGMTIVFGRSEVMEHVVKQYKSPETQQTTIKPSHPEVPETEVSLGRNPDFLIVYDQASQMEGGGMSNCLTCTYFTANKPCPARPDHEVMNQALVTELSTGGCVWHKFLADLEEMSGHMSYSNAKMDGIVDMTEGRNIVIWKNGNVTQVPVELPDAELESDVSEDEPADDFTPPQEWTPEGEDD